MLASTTPKLAKNKADRIKNSWLEDSTRNQTSFGGEGLKLNQFAGHITVFHLFTDELYKFEKSSSRELRHRFLPVRFPEGNF